MLLAPSLLLGATVDLPRTGQTTCYTETGVLIACAGTGQDGEIQAGIAWPDPRFSDNGDGTITDHLTGLVWLKNTDCFGRIKWSEALAAANGLADGTCGLTDSSAAGDWRLPNVLELASPAHMGVADSIAWLESFGFTGMDTIVRWSSTTDTAGFTAVFGYQFRDRWTSALVKTGTYKVWPVRGAATGPAKLWKTGQTTCYDDLSNDSVACPGTGQDGEIQAGVAWPDPRFNDNGDGTVTDNLTGLIWLEDTNCFGSRFWSDALSDASSLADGDCSLTDNSTASDWRLPNTWEVLSLNDFSRSYPALPPTHPFTNISGWPHWTSTSQRSVGVYGYQGKPGGKGGYSFALKTEASNVWPVRGELGAVPPIFEDGFESGDTSAWSGEVP